MKPQHVGTIDVNVNRGPRNAAWDRPGVRTTEFWLTVSVVVVSTLLAVFDAIDAQWAVTASTVAGAVYAGLRTAAKIVAQREHLRSAPPLDADADSPPRQSNH